jgi:hypothetical protein
MKTGTPLQYNSWTTRSLWFGLHQQEMQQQMYSKTLCCLNEAPQLCWTKKNANWTF